MAKKTVAKVSKKKITAPKTYKPTGNRPREHLAYLNEREMEYLRSINGNNMERGPRGLPSFPPDDAIGSSSVSSGTKTGTSTGSKSSGPGGPSGPNSGPSGTHSTSSSSGKSTNSNPKSPSGPSGPNSSSSGSHSTSTGGNLGGGNKGGTGSGQIGSKGGGASTQKPGAGGNAGVVGGGNKGNPTGGSLQAPNRTAPSSPKSPMGGQGTSFSTPQKASGFNADKINQQKTQTNDAKQGLNNTPAAKKDLATGGIKTLNVGPMGTPVNVGKQPAAAKPASWSDTFNKMGTTISSSLAVARSFQNNGIAALGDPSISFPGSAQPASGKQFNDRVPNITDIVEKSPISTDATQRITEAYKAPTSAPSYTTMGYPATYNPSYTTEAFKTSKATQPRDELGAMPSDISEEEYGWAGTGPSKLAAYQSNRVYGANIKEPITQEQYDTMLAVNTGVDPRFKDALMTMSPEKRQAAAIVSSAARLNDVDIQSAIKNAAIESGFGSIKNKPGSSYQGLMQMGSGEFAKYADDLSQQLGRNDPWASAQAGVAYMKDIEGILERKNVPVNAGTVYGAYQQGPYGYPKLANNPDKLAKDVVGRDAVVRNLGPDAPASADKITAGEFAKYVAGKPDAAFNEHTGYSTTQKQITDRVPEEQGFVAGISNTTPPAGYKEAMPKEYGPLGENAYDRIPAEIESGPNRGIASLNPGYVGPVNDPRLQYSSGAFPAREPSTYSGATFDPKSDLQQDAIREALQGSLYARSTTATVNPYKDVTQTGSPQMAGSGPTVRETPTFGLPSDPRLAYAATGGIPAPVNTPSRSLVSDRSVVPTGSPIMAGGVPTVPGGIGTKIGTEVFGPPNVTGLSTSIGDVLQEQYDKDYIANFATDVMSGLPSLDQISKAYSELKPYVDKYVTGLRWTPGLANSAAITAGKAAGIDKYIGQGISALKGVVENGVIAAVQAGAAMGAPVVDIEGAQRAVETVSRAEDRYRTDRAPTDDGVVTKEIDAEKILDVEDVPPEGKLYTDRIPGSSDPVSFKNPDAGASFMVSEPVDGTVVFSEPSYRTTSAVRQGDPVYDAAVKAYNESITALNENADVPEYTRVPTEETFSPFKTRTYDSPYPVDENGVPIQDVSPEDMAKMQLRRRGEEYTPTAEEKAAMVAGSGVQRLFGGLGKSFNVKEQMLDYYSRPSWEQDYAREKAKQDQIARDSGGRVRVPGSKPSGVPGSGVSTSGPGGGITDIGTGGKNEYRPPDVVTTAPRPTMSTTGNAPSGADASGGERPSIYYSWDVGVNIPSPGDPNYTLYLRYLQERAAAQAAMGIA